MDINYTVSASIIVPVYNCEKYIGKCIDSILAQTFQDFELLLVIDGGVDASLMICKDYASRDNRISVIEQENQGVSAARNNGLDHATGEYVFFVDSDDWVEPDYLEKLINKAEETDCDIVICGYYGETEEKSWETGFFRFDEHVFTEDEKFSLCNNCLFFDKNARMDSTIIVGVPWAKLYRRIFLKQPVLLICIILWKT